MRNIALALLTLVILATQQPRRGENSTSRSFFSSISAERSVVRLTPNSAARLASVSRSPAASSLLRILRLRVCRTTSGSERCEITSTPYRPNGHYHPIARQDYRAR